jgi:hypothetical protein
MKRLHPLLMIGVFTVVFLEIHPFQDGNGRLSRILATLLLLQAGYTCVPYSSLESVIEQTKEAYHLALRHRPRARSAARTRIGSHGSCFFCACSTSRCGGFRPKSSAKNLWSRRCRTWPFRSPTTSGTRPRYLRRYDPRHGRKPQHPQGALPQPRRHAVTGHARRRQRLLVRSALARACHHCRGV